MQYWKCKCGEMEYWGSGMIPCPCIECSKCNTVPSNFEGPDKYKKAIPHEFIVNNVETDNGPQPLSGCKWCYKTKAQIEKVKLA